MNVLFRGIDIETSEYVYGYYFKSDKFEEQNRPSNLIYSIDDSRVHQIYEESLSIFTGMTDMNGTRIFSSDDVKSPEGSGKVVMKDGCWVIDEAGLLYDFKPDDLLVLGK